MNTSRSKKEAMWEQINNLGPTMPKAVIKQSVLIIIYLIGGSS